MPTYVYECSRCKDVFEVEQRISENALDECACGSKGTVKRLIQPVGVMFKGSGFHINDYAAKSESAKDEAPKSEPAATESAPTESAPATAPQKDAAAPSKPAAE